MNHNDFPISQTPLIQFDLQQEKPSIIKVIGVGGGGSNAVNHMYKQGIKGVDFIVCNTDAKALAISPVPVKIQLGPGLTQGMGAGSIPDVGRQAVIENVDEFRQLLSGNTRMAFITAGMGGGTGTGAAPIIAGLAKEMGILTVGIVTVPFAFEGRKRKLQAEAGIDEMKKNVDALLVICNDKLREIYGNLNLSMAFGHADDVLTVAAKSIAEIITNTMHISTDFADIQTVMKDSGVAIMGSASAEGDNRAIRAAEAALDSPLLNDSVIEGANYILLNITSGDIEVTMDEVGEINDYVQAQAGQTADIIMGIGHDEALGNKVAVTIIATGFKTNTGGQIAPDASKSEVVVHQLVDAPPVNEKPAPVPVSGPEATTVSSASEVVSEVKNPLEPVLIIRDEPAATTVQNMTTGPVSTQSSYMASFSAPGNGIFEFEFPEDDVLHKQQAAPPTKEMVSEDDHQAPPAGITYQETPAVDYSLQEMQNELVNSSLSENMNDEEVIRHELYDEARQQPPLPAAYEQTLARPMSPEEEMYHNSRERIMRLREMNSRMSSPNGIADMEKQPAYMRRNVKLENTPSSLDSNVSRYTLSVDENRPEIRVNNQFIHDRVD